MPRLRTDACRLSEAETVIYDHGDVDQLAWRLRNADGRAALIVTEGVFALDGDIAPLEALAALAHRFDVRLMVSEAHGLGAVGPDGRGAIAAAGLRGQVDVIVGSLGSALGAAGGYAACDRMLARYLAAHARTFAGSTALPPPAVAAAMAALELLREQPRRVEKLQANADCLRTELAREGFDVAGADAHVISIVVGEPRLAVRIAELALEQGVYIGAVLPPDVTEGCARLRLSVMASHTKSELRDAARVLGRAALRAGFRPPPASRWPRRHSTGGVRGVNLAPWISTSSSSARARAARRPPSRPPSWASASPSWSASSASAASPSTPARSRRRRCGWRCSDELARRPLDIPDPLNPEGRERAAIEFLMDRAARVVGAEAQVVREQFRRNRVGLLFGNGQFVDEHTISITDDDGAKTGHRGPTSSSPSAPIPRGRPTCSSTTST